MLFRSPEWLIGVMGRYLATTGMPRHENYPAKYAHRVTRGTGGERPIRHESMTWTDIKKLRDFWPRKLIVKGIQHAQDAVMAADCGADGVVISNHGGRVLDSTMAPILALPEILEAVNGRATVIVDSGFRRGSDIVKALAIGADAVMLGRGPDRKSTRLNSSH